LVEPDGAVRTVTYTADDVNGFNAVVERSAPAVVKAAPVVKAVKTFAAPVAYAHAAPAVYAHHAAPAVYAHATPVVKSFAAPVAYAHAAPAVYAHHAAPAFAAYHH